MTIVAVLFIITKAVTTNARSAIIYIYTYGGGIMDERKYFLSI